MTTQNPFSTPTISPGQSGGFNWNGGSNWNTPSFASYFFNQNPQAGVSAFVNQQGTNPFYGYSQWLNALSGNLFNNYTAQTLAGGDPNLNFTDYLRSVGPALQNQYELFRSGGRGIGPRRLF